MKAIILAGGFATRLWPLSENTAKPLIQLKGRPLCSYLVEQLPVDMEIVIATNAVFAQAFEDWQKSEFADRKITILKEDEVQGETSKKGALAAVALCVQELKIDDDILVLAGDNYFGFDIQDFIVQAQDKDTAMLAAYDVGDVEEASKYGVVVPAGQNEELLAAAMNSEHCESSESEHEVRRSVRVKNEENASTSPLEGEIERGNGDDAYKTKNATDCLEIGRVQKFMEKPANPPSTLVSTGVLFFPQHTLGLLSDCSEKHPDDLGIVFEYLLQAKKPIHYYPFSEAWYDIGSFSSYLDAQRYMIGEKVVDHGAQQIGNNTFEGSVYLADNVIVENSTLKDCIVERGSVIRNTQIRNSVIGADSTLLNVDLNTVSLRKESFVSS